MNMAAIVAFSNYGSCRKFVPIICDREPVTSRSEHIFSNCYKITVTNDIFKSRHRLRSQQMNVIPGQQAVHLAGKWFLEKGLQFTADGGDLAGIDAGLDPHL